MAEKGLLKAEAKIFLGALFNRPSKNTVQATESQQSTASNKQRPDLTASQLMAEEEKLVKALQGFQIQKANQLDVIFARAAQNIADLREDQDDESHLIDILAPFPKDLPMLYKVLIFRLENDKYFDRLIPFTLRRLHEYGNADRFIDYIYSRIEARSTQIQEVCSANAIVLTDSTRAFLDINFRTDQLRTDVATVDDQEVYEAQLRGIKFTGKATRTTSAILTNVALLMKRICALRPTLQLFQESQEQETAGKPVSALRKLYQTEESSTHLQSQLSIVKWLATAIPDMKLRLVASALQGVTQTLEHLRNQNNQVGFATLQNVCHTRRIFISPYYVKDRDRHSSGNVIDNNIQLYLSLRPLFHYRHVLGNLIDEGSFSGLGSGYLFDCYLSYMAERQNQVQTKLHHVEQLETVDSIRQFLQNIVGVFAIELYVSQVIPGVSSQMYYEEMWRQAAQVAVESLEGSLRVINDETSYRDTRDLLALFVETVRMLRCDPADVGKAATKFALYYCDVLVELTTVRLERALKADPLTPIILNNDAEKNSLSEILDYWLEEPNASFPRSLPFSTSVPKTGSLIKAYISSLSGVWRDLRLGREIARDKTVALTKYLLEHNVRQCFSKALSSNSLKKTGQYIQFHCNFSYLEEALPALESHIATELRVPREGVQVEWGHVFGLLRVEAEIRLFKCLTSTVETVVKSYRLDILTRPTSETPEARRIIDHFNEFMAVSAVLPNHILRKAWAIFNATLPVAIQLFLVQECKAVSVEGLQQLRTDFDLYENVLKKHIHHAPEPDCLNDTFLVLRQVIDLICTDDWVAYFASYGMPGFRYDRVTTEMAGKVLEKLREPEDKSSNLLSNLKVNRQRNKKKEAILTQLTDLGGYRFLTTRTPSVVQNARSFFTQ